MRRYSVLLWIFLFSIFLQVPVFASTIPIDLNSFLTDDPSEVIIDPTGTSATMSNSTPYWSVYLFNDYIIDPIPWNLFSLQFDFDFTKPGGGDSEFFAFIYDSNNYDPLNPIREFYTSASQSDTVSWDLTGLDPSILSLGLEFQLNTNESFPGGQVTIGNVAYETNPIPEPGSIILLGMGLLACAFGTRKEKIIK